MIVTAMRSRQHIAGVIQKYGSAIENDPDWKQERTFQLDDGIFDNLIETIGVCARPDHGIPCFSFEGYTVRRANPWSTPLDAIWTQKTLDKT